MAHSTQLHECFLKSNIYTTGQNILYSYATQGFSTRSSNPVTAANHNSSNPLCILTLYASEINFNTPLRSYQNLDNPCPASYIFQPNVKTHFQHLNPTSEGRVFLNFKYKQNIYQKMHTIGLQTVHKFLKLMYGL
jgi:hypothetical protein